MRLAIDRAAARVLLRMPRSDAAALRGKLDQLAAAPFADHPWAKSFGGGRGRVRQGDWRALYEIDRAADELIVRDVAHRREAYR